MVLLLSRLKNLFQDLVVEILYFLDFLREMELSKFFLLVVLFVYFGICGLYLSFVFRLFRVYSVYSIYFLFNWYIITIRCSVVILKKFQLIFVNV